MEDFQCNYRVETLWNFVHVGFLKLRMSTSEIHLNSLPVSKLNSEPTTLKWNTEDNFNLKLAAPYHVHIHALKHAEKHQSFILGLKLNENTTCNRLHHKGTQK